MTVERQLRGNHGEQLATRFLKERGYRIIAQNYRCRYGELDIIARRDEYLVFCEVKTRMEGPIHPTASVTAKKKKKLRQLGLWYMTQQRLLQVQPRFDVISVQLRAHEAPLIEHFINAL